LTLSCPVSPQPCAPPGRQRAACAPQEPKREWDVPRVSPYRLAAHLTSAFAIFAGLLWTALDVLRPGAAGAEPPSTAGALRAAGALRRWALPVTGLVALTACSGDARPGPLTVPTQ
jgi:heme A synthase